MPSAKARKVRFRVARTRPPPGRDQRGAGLEKALLVGDVLDHLHGAHQVELTALGNQLLGGCHPVVDRECGGAGVADGRLDAGRRKIDPGDRSAEAGKRLAQEAAAAADVDHRQAGQRPLRQGIAPEVGADAVADIAEPDRVELVQRRQRPRLVPPVLGQIGEALEFGCVGAGRHPVGSHQAASELACSRPPEYVHASP